jgi:hypothetical protein
MLMNTRTLEDGSADRRRLADRGWVPAANGTELPMRYLSGHTLLYCYNPVLQLHAHLNCETDLFVEGAELDSIMNWPYILPQGCRIDLTQPRFQENK